MVFNPISASASVTPASPLVAPAQAQWVINVEEKTSTANLLGGIAVISRNEKGFFRSEYRRPYSTEVDGEVQEAEIKLSTNLKECANLVLAQARAEAVIRETLHKLYPDVMTEAVAVEQEEIGANAPEDPF